MVYCDQVVAEGKLGGASWAPTIGLLGQQAKCDVHGMWAARFACLRFEEVWLTAKGGGN